MYKYHLAAAVDAEDEDEHVLFHIQYSLMSYFMYLVGTIIFMKKNATYINVVYLTFYIELERIHEYNWGLARLVYLYSKLGETSLWKTRQMRESHRLFTVINLQPLYYY